MNTSTAQQHRLFSTLMNGHSNIATDEEFKLKSDHEFEDRSKIVFDDLKALETAHKQRQLYSPREQFLKDSDSFDFPVHVKPKVCNKTEKTSVPVLFKKPLKRKRSILPDYVKHPEKWLKYSLADVPEHTEALNAIAAQQFLESVKKHVDQTVDDKIIFKKQVKLDTVLNLPTSPSGNETSQFQNTSSLVVMPECVVGKKNPCQISQRKPKSVVNLSKTTNRFLSSRSRINQISIGHLYETAEDEMNE